MLYIGYKNLYYWRNPEGLFILLNMQILLQLKFIRRDHLIIIYLNTVVCTLHYDTVHVFTCVLMNFNWASDISLY